MRRTPDICYRLYRLRLVSGVLMGLPLVLVLVWYAWSAFAQLDRYRQASDDPVVLDLALFHIAFHDELVRDLRRLTLPAPGASELPTFDLSLSRDGLDELYRQLYEEGDARDYQRGYLRTGGVIRDISMRFRGSKPWHWLNTQKSMKLRLDKADLLEGTRVFNLINDPTPFGLEDQIVLDLARAQGLLTPEYHAARVRLNNSDLGVYRYAAQPTEGLLRRGRRIPGNLYSGDSEAVHPELGVGALFFSRDGWQQVAWRSGVGAQNDEFEPLDRLLAAVQSGSFEQFAAYAH